MRRWFPLLLVSVPLLLAGCGGGSNPADTGVTPASDSLPGCAEVWVVGERLPDDYEGCVDAEGTLQVSEIKDCTSAEGRFTTFGDNLFAMLGEEIHRDTGSLEYRQIYGTCFGTDW